MAVTKQHPKEQLFFSGTSYFSALLRDIRNAQKTIEMESYIFSWDHLGKKIFIALKRAAERGVKVRLLLDGAGSYDWNPFIAKRLEQVGGKCQVFHPFPWSVWHWSRNLISQPWLMKMIYLLLKINSRNHRKTCIIDHRIIYVGSLNISGVHLTHGKNLGWRDTGIRLAQGNLREPLKAFNAAWSGLTLPQKIQRFFHHADAPTRFRLNYTRHQRRFLRRNLLARIHHSTKRIWITNAYFVPDTFLLRALIKAAERAVDVRILLPAQSDLAFMPWATRMFYEQLLRSGVRIFEYLPTMLHAKTLIIDQWMTIGSSNFNHRSLLHDLEIDVVVKTDNARFELISQFQNDLTAAREIKLKEWEKRPWYQNLFGRLILYLKYFI